MLFDAEHIPSPDSMERIAISERVKTSKQQIKENKELRKRTQRAERANGKEAKRRAIREEKEEDRRRQERAAFSIEQHKRERRERLRYRMTNCWEGYSSVSNANVHNKVLSSGGYVYAPGFTAPLTIASTSYHHSSGIHHRGTYYSGANHGSIRYVAIHQGAGYY